MLFIGFAGIRFGVLGLGVYGLRFSSCPTCLLRCMESLKDLKVPGLSNVSKVQHWLGFKDLV